MNAPQAVTDDRAVSPEQARRTLWFCAVGAMIGLCLAGFSLFTAKGTRTSNVPPEDAALVNGVPILTSDFVDQLRQADNLALSTATPGQKKKVLDDMIREELVVQRGIELGLQSDIVEVRAALVSAVEAQVTNSSNLVPPNPVQVRQFFDLHREKYSDEGEMEFSDYVSVAPIASDAAATFRRSGGDKAVATALGFHAANPVNSKEYYFAAKARLGLTVFSAVQALRDGQISDLIRDGDTDHLVVMRINKRPTVAPFESVIDRVTRDYAAEQAQLLQQRTDTFLLQRADILIQPEL